MSVVGRDSRDMDSILTDGMSGPSLRPPPSCSGFMAEGMSAVASDSSDVDRTPPPLHPYS
jgi:hypothetical protein